jgi:iron complex outermembrane receptor protein
VKNLLFSSLLLWISCGVLIGQEYGTLTGTVRDSVGEPVELANVALLGTSEGTMTNPEGSFRLRIPAGRSFTVVVSCVVRRQAPAGRGTGTECQAQLGCAIAE